VQRHSTRRNWYGHHTHYVFRPRRSVSAWEMELKPRPRVIGLRTNPRATSSGREEVREQENSSVLRETLVDAPSSAMMTTSASGELYARVSPLHGGGARSFAPLARSKSVGEAIRPPRGSSSRRSIVHFSWGKKRWNAATRVR